MEPHPVTGDRNLWGDTQALAESLWLSLCWLGIGLHWLLRTRCYTQRLARQSSLMEEAPFCRGWWLTRRRIHLQLGKEQRMRDSRRLSPKWDVNLTPLLPTSSFYGCFVHIYPVIISHWKRKWSILLVPWNSFKNIFLSKTPEWLLFFSNSGLKSSSQNIS